MKKSIPIGKSDFKRVISENYYYVDKTALIEEILRKKPEVLFLTRPRRFGKTLNMSTLKYFFDIKDGVKNRELFKGLNIEKTEYMSEQGKYPVIFISMKELSGETYEEFFKEFQIVLKDVYSEHKYLRESLEEWEKKDFDKILYKDETAEYTVALKNLSRYLFEYHGVKSVLLIDEYDAPMINANEKGYYEKAKNLISKFYGSALKDGICAFAVVTGILKVAKESVFSTLNNLKVSTILTGEYNHFGMSEEEVIEILKYYGWETTLEDTKRWYNGYLFGESRVYNPWSILSHCEMGKLEAFWVGTSANTLIKEILKNADKRIYNLMYTLLQDEEVKARLQESMVFTPKFDNNTLLYLMLSAGYLTIARKGENEDEYFLTIPNYEVKKYFKTTFIDIVTTNSGSSFSLLEEALLEGNILISGGKVDSIEELIQEMFKNSMSYMDTSTTEEKFYHNLILGMVIGLDGKYIPLSNREAGYGRYDLALIPNSNDKKAHGYIFEFKVAKDKKEMDRLGEEALSQIERKNYEREFLSRGFTNIHKIGMVFYKKDVKIYV